MTRDGRETQLVLRAQVGDRAALEDLFGLVQEPLYRYIAGLVGESHLAEDILQEVLVRIYRKIDWLRDPGLFRPWCYRLTTREAFRRLKRERPWRDLLREEAVLYAVAAPDPPQAPDEELLALLPEMIGRVSPASRAVLALHYLEHLTIDEIAAELNLPIGTVKSRLAYGLSVLRQSAENLSL